MYPAKYKKKIKKTKVTIFTIFVNTCGTIQYQYCTVNHDAQYIEQNN